MFIITLDSVTLTWSAAVSWLFMTTPRAVRLLTQEIPGLATVELKLVLVTYSGVWGTSNLRL